MPKDDIIGGIGGAMGSILLNVNWIAFLADTGMKVVATVIIGVAGGFAGLAGKEIFQFLKTKINGNK